MFQSKGISFSSSSNALAHSGPGMNAYGACGLAGSTGTGQQFSLSPTNFRSKKPQGSAQITFVCIVCLKDRPMASAVTLKSCVDHYYICRTCLIESISSQIKAHSPKVKCPVIGCEREIPEKEIKSLVEANIFANYLKIRGECCGGSGLKEQPRKAEMLPTRQLQPAHTMYASTPSYLNYQRNATRTTTDEEMYRQFHQRQSIGSIP